MTDYQIQASTRRCSSTGRELKAGERYYSVLVDEAGSLVRRDYAADAWEGPPAGAFGFWQGRIPTGQTPKRPPIDDEMLGECFQRLEGELEPGKVSFRYVLALLLIRRRRFRLEDTRKDGGQVILVLRCSKTGTRHDVIDPGLADAELETVQDDVFRVLGWN